MIRQFISTRPTSRSRIDVDVAAQVRLIKESWIWIVFLSRTAPPEGRYGSINELSEWPAIAGLRRCFDAGGYIINKIVTHTEGPRLDLLSSRAAPEHNRPARPRASATAQLPQTSADQLR